MGIFQIAIIGIVASMLSIVLKKDNASFSLLIGLSASVLILILIMTGLGNSLSLIKEIASAISSNIPFVDIIIKIIGIAYITELATQICIDAGETAIAGKIELGGKIIVLGVSTPIILSLLKTVQDLI